MKSHHSPEGKFTVKIVQSAADNGNLLTLLNIRVEAGGGNNKHIHGDLTETFKVISGEISVRNGAGFVDLKKGEVLAINAHTPHHFINRSGAPAEFMVVVMPGDLEFEAEILAGGDL